ncbi:MAG: DNA methyltransferase [Negativicutes bacterium]|nr:DNA methyltransferase [Negativicutes bacterium]
MASKNSNLHGAKQAKNDEFYTQYHDIEKEMQAYLDYNPDVFRDKVVLLPCDDPEWSNFTKYFAQRFSELGLKKLISTSYVQPNHASSDAKGKIFTLSRDSNHDGVVDINDLEWKYLEGDGDFRSDEVTKLRDEADFIITNPPFSLFREFLGWIMDGGKTFAIIGSMNAITYKEVFPLIKDNKMWLGLYNGAKEYNLPNGDVQKMGNTLWFTNVEHGKRHQPLDIDTMDNNLRFNSQIKNDSKSYQKYDNYDAIEVPRTDGIPSDYDGVMGVPISFLDKYCPEQFEILGCSYSYGKPDGWNDDVNMNVSINGKPIYKRLLIQHKNQTPTKKEINHEN